MTPDRAITCTNADGKSLTFGADYSPYLLVDAEGLYGFDVEVNAEDNTMIDGATYYGSVVQKRNIVLTISDKSEARGQHWAHRMELAELFKPRMAGTLLYRDGSHNRQISYYVEKLEPAATGPMYARETTVSLICPDPYYYATEETTVSSTTSVGAFEFPFENPVGEAFEFSELNEKKSFYIEIGDNAENQGAADSIGLTITVTAVGGAVSGPRLTWVNGDDRKVMFFADNIAPMSMAQGDVLQITTGSGHKMATLNGESCMAYAYFWPVDSTLTQFEFFQLKPGTNIIAYDADSGAENMKVAITYRMKYEGA